MSRTHAHVPSRVEWARVTDKSILDLHHPHYVPGVGVSTCMDPACRQAQDVPRWASAQRWTRGGCARIERRAAVRDQLRQASKRYQADSDVELDVLVDPDRYCLCQMCGCP